MKALLKTDECISMLEEAGNVFSPIHYSGNGHFNKEDLIDFQSRTRAMLDYRLLPLGVITIPNHADKEEVRINPVLKNVKDFEAFWYVMKNYQLVTADNLKNEFWGVCTDLDSIPAYLDVMNLKFRNVNYNYETDIDKIKINYSGLNQRVEEGVLSVQEADKIYWNIHFIADRYNLIMHSIRSVFKEFRDLSKSKNDGKKDNRKDRRSKPKTLGELFSNDRDRVSTIQDALSALTITSDSNLVVCGFITGCKEAHKLPDISNEDLLRVIYNELGSEKGSLKFRKEGNKYDDAVKSTKQYFDIR